MELTRIVKLQDTKPDVKQTSLENALNTQIKIYKNDTDCIEVRGIEKNGGMSGMYTGYGLNDEFMFISMSTNAEADLVENPIEITF